MLLFLVRKALFPLLALCLSLPAFAVSVDVAAGDSEQKSDKKVVKKVVTIDGDEGNVEVVESGDLDECDAPDILSLGPFGDLNGLGMMASRGFLGVRLMELTPELRQHFGAPEDAGVMIGKVEPDSPAAKAGLKVGDIVTEVDGEKVGSSWSVQRQIRKKDEGDKAEIQFLRDGRPQTVSATVAKRDKPQVDLGKTFKLKLKPGPGGAEQGYLFQLNAERLAEAAKELQEHTNSPEFQEQLRHGRDLEKRMKELEKKLQEMEKRLKERSALGASTNRT